MRLTNSEPQKVKAIKAVRELTGWNSRGNKVFTDVAHGSLHKVRNKVEAMHYRVEFSPINAQTENA